MITLPPEPSAKDPVSATFIRALMRYIRANTLLNGPGYRAKRGPNGTTLAIKSTSAAKTVDKTDVGRFAIISKKDEELPDEQPPVKVMTNCYYEVGGKTYMLEDKNLPNGSEDETVYVALKVVARGPVASAEIARYVGLDRLREAQADQGYYIHPIYAIDKDQNVLVDFRVGPSASMGEF